MEGDNSPRFAPFAPNGGRHTRQKSPGGEGQSEGSEDSVFVSVELNGLSSPRGLASPSMNSKFNPNDPIMTRQPHGDAPRLVDSVPYPDVAGMNDRISEGQNSSSPQARTGQRIEALNGNGKLGDKFRSGEGAGEGPREELIEGLVAMEPPAILAGVVSEASTTRAFNSQDFWQRKKNEMKVSKFTIDDDQSNGVSGFQPTEEFKRRASSDFRRGPSSEFKRGVSSQSFQATQSMNSPGGRQRTDPAATPWKRAVVIRLSAAVLSMIFAWIGVLYPTTLLDQQIELVSASKILLRHQTLIDGVRYYDEILTANARMCKHVGTPVFKEEYDAAVTLMDEALLEVSNLRPELAAKFDETTVHANNMLIEMETEALMGCEEAVDLSTITVNLESDSYEEQKAVLLEGLQLQRKDLENEKSAYKERVFEEMDRVWTAIYVCVSLFSSFFGILVASGALVDMNQESWLREAKRNALARGELEKDDDALEFWSKKQLFMLPCVVVMVFISILVPFGLNNSALSLRRMGDELIDLRSAVGDLKYYDEVLTSSARMCAVTGDMRWKARYLEAVGKMSSALEKIGQIEELLKQNYQSVRSANWDYGKAFTASVSSYNEKLVDQEQTVLQRCASSQGSDEYERLLLFNSVYLDSKASLRSDLHRLEEAVNQATNEQIDNNNRRIKNSYKTGSGLLCAAQFFNGVMFIFIMYRMDTLKFSTKVYAASKAENSNLGFLTYK